MTVTMSEEGTKVKSDWRWGEKRLSVGIKLELVYISDRAISAGLKYAVTKINAKSTN